MYVATFAVEPRELAGTINDALHKAETADEQSRTVI